MNEDRMSPTELQRISSHEVAPFEDHEADLHLNDPIPYEGWLPSEAQIRRFCDQLRSEPEWQEQHQQFDDRQSDSDDGAIVAMPDRSSFRRRKSINNGTALRNNSIRP